MPQFAKSTDGHVNLVDPAGSLWHGSATLMLARQRFGRERATLLPGRIEWRTAFWPLFTGRVRMDMRQRSDARPDHRRCGPARRDLSPGAIAVPASLLSASARRSIRSIMQGDVRLAWTEWRSFEQEAFGQLTVTLDDVVRACRWSSRWVRTGWCFRRRARSSTIDLTTTLKGPLMLSGQGHGVARHRRVQRRGDGRPGGTRKPGGIAEPVRTAIAGPDTVDADLRALRREPRCRQRLAGISRSSALTALAVPPLVAATVDDRCADSSLRRPASLNAAGRRPAPPHLPVSDSFATCPSRRRAP